MAGIWISQTGDEWKPAAAQPFPYERTLHDLAAKNPQLLPLAGSPQLVVLGSEVRMGSGYADILAVEASGRPVIVEVKLARSAEAKRAVVAQVLAYAAFLQGSDVKTLEASISGQLSAAGCGSILEAVQSQEEDADGDAFTASLQEHLDNGRFRLVLLLDETSHELERIVAYLDAITAAALTIDLITVSVYEVNGAQVALPQRISADAVETIETVTPRQAASGKIVVSDGSDAFVASVASVANMADKDRQAFDRLIEWAKKLEGMPNVRLSTQQSPGGFSLRPKILPDNKNLATIWDYDYPAIALKRSVFESRAPKSIETVEKAAGIKIGHDNYVPHDKIENEDDLETLLDALTQAYAEATGNSTPDPAAQPEKPCA